jgi:hypothetical protein
MDFPNGHKKYQDNFQHIFPKSRESERERERETQSFLKESYLRMAVCDNPTLHKIQRFHLRLEFTNLIDNRN